MRGLGFCAWKGAGGVAGNPSVIVPLCASTVVQGAYSAYQIISIVKGNMLWASNQKCLIRHSKRTGTATKPIIALKETVAVSSVYRDSFAEIPLLEPQSWEELVWLLPYRGALTTWRGALNGGRRGATAVEHP